MSEQEATPVVEKQQTPEVDNKTETKVTLPSSLKIVLGALAALTAFVIIAIFAGDIEDTGTKIVSTVLYFGTFLLLTRLDSLFYKRPVGAQKYLPTSANIFILGYGLIMTWIVYTPSFTWGTTYQESNSENALLTFFPLVFIVKLTTYACIAVWNYATGKNSLIQKTGYVTVVAALATVVGGFLPMLIESATGYGSTGAYWKFILALVMITAFGASSLVLIAAAFRKSEPEVSEMSHTVSPPLGNAVLVEETSVPEKELKPWPADLYGHPVPMLQDGAPNLLYAWDHEKNRPFVLKD